MTSPEASTEVVVLVGLPGSGKTTELHRIARDTGAVPIDDYRDGGGEDPAESPQHARLLEALASPHPVVVADIGFCDAPILDAFVHHVTSLASDANVDIRYYERDVWQCWQNLDRREAETPRGSLAADRAELSRLALVYAPPPHGSLVPVWRPDAPGA